MEDDGFVLEVESGDEGVLEVGPKGRVAVVEEEGVGDHVREGRVGCDWCVFPEVAHVAGYVGVPDLGLHHLCEPVYERWIGEVDDAGFEAGTAGYDGCAVDSRILHEILQSIRFIVQVATKACRFG